MIDLYKALLKAQSEMPPVKETSTNPHFKSRYADLETVIDTVRPVLNKHGLLFVQGGASQDGKPWLMTQVIHAESGDFLNFSFPIVSKDADDPQKMGAAITYAKRYGLLAILGIATEDDDGNTASTAPRSTQRREPPNGNGNTSSPERLTSWTDFWSWARANGFEKKAQIEKFIGGAMPDDPQVAKDTIDSLMPEPEDA